MVSERLFLQSVEVRAVSVPLKRPVVSKVGRFERWPLVLIDLHTRQGVTGRAYLEPYLERSIGPIASLVRDLAATRQDKAIAPLDDFHQGRRALNLVGYEGLAMIAVAGLDMAAWDALAQAAGRPLAELLGGGLGPVPAYNSNGLWLTDVGALAPEARELAAEGRFTALKLRLGRPRLEDDLRAIAAVREGAGSDVQLMVDFNQGLTAGQVLQRCRDLDDAGLYWLEEPTTYNDLSGHARLARDLKTPVQIGENFYGPRELLRAIQLQAADFVMLDLMRIGGISGWLQAAPIAAAHGIPVSTHLYPEVAAHLMRVTETAHWLEWQDWANPVLKQPFALEAGHLVIPPRPGCGIEWEPSAVARYAL